MVSTISESGYDVRWQSTWYGTELDIDVFDDLLDVPGWVEAVARRR